MSIWEVWPLPGPGPTVDSALPWVTGWPVSLVPSLLLAGGPSKPPPWAWCPGLQPAQGLAEALETSTPTIQEDDPIQALPPPRVASRRECRSGPEAGAGVLSSSGPLAAHVPHPVQALAPHEFVVSSPR